MPEQELRIAANDPLLTYRGAVSLQDVGGGVAPWRVPHQDMHLFFPEGGIGRGAMPSGVRVAFRFSGPWFRLHYFARPAPEAPGPPVESRIDVLLDGHLHTVLPVVSGMDGHTQLVEGLPGHDTLVEIWLPTLNQFVLRGIDAPASAGFVRDTSACPRWVHFGSSESQGRGAPSPSRTWPALVSRGLGWDLTSLAMGAGCHLQPLYGMLMRDLPADVLSLCVGMNIYGQNSLNEFTYRANLIGLVRLIRERHPTAPVVVMSHFYAPKHEEYRPPGRFCLADTREHTREAVEILRDRGDQNVHYLHGPDVFGPEDWRLYLEPMELDPLHFGPEGHRTVAAAVERRLRRLAPNLVGTDHRGTPTTAAVDLG